MTIRRFCMSEQLHFFTAKEGVGPFLVIIGRRGSGKSVLVRDLLHFFQDIPRGMVVDSKESSGDAFYAQFLPAECIESEFSVALMETLFRRQLHVVHSRYEAGEKEKDNRMFLVLDNCMYDQTWSREKIVRTVFMNGRCWKILTVLTAGYPLGMPPVLRAAVDFAFLFFAPTADERKRLFENYAPMFPSFEAFNSVFDQITSERRHECMVVCNPTVRTDRQLQDLVRFYRANIWPPSFRMSACAAP